MVLTLIIKMLTTSPLFILLAAFPLLILMKSRFRFVQPFSSPPFPSLRFSLLHSLPPPFPSLLFTFYTLPPPFFSLVQLKCLFSLPCPPFLSLLSPVPSFSLLPFLHPHLLPLSPFPSYLFQLCCILLPFLMESYYLLIVGWLISNLFSCFHYLIMTK